MGANSRFLHDVNGGTPFALWVFDSMELKSHRNPRPLGNYFPRRFSHSANANLIRMEQWDDRIARVTCAGASRQPFLQSGAPKQIKLEP